MLDKILQLLFPPKCIFCNKILTFRTVYHICSECYEKAKFYELDRSWPLRNAFQSESCDGIICVFEYVGIVREAVKKFKFCNKPSYYRTLASLIAERMFCVEHGYGWDVIIAVPMFKDRLQKRGYDQAALLAKEISNRVSVPFSSDVIIKKRKTSVQSLLSRAGRRENVKDVFEIIEKDKIKGKKVLIIDDILTTGSTIDECARILKDAGAIQVLAGVIAIAGRR